MAPASGSHRAGRALSPSPSPSAPVDLAAYLLPATRAPRIELTDQDAKPFSLGSDGGARTFVFFGYTHCADVCPATIGRVGEAIAALGSGVRGVFVTVDPERDTTAWLNEFVRYMPKGFSAVTGTAAEIADHRCRLGRAVRARRDRGRGRIHDVAHRGRLPRRRGRDASGALSLRHRSRRDDRRRAPGARATAAAAAPASAAPTTADAERRPRPPSCLDRHATATPSTATPEAPLGVEVLSTSIWSGPPGPIILALSVDGVRLADLDLRPTVQLASMNGEPFGPTVTAIPVQPPGIKVVSYVATPADRAAGRLARPCHRRVGRSPGARRRGRHRQGPGFDGDARRSRPERSHADARRRGWHRPRSDDGPGARPPAVDPLHHRCPVRPHAIRSRRRFGSLPRVTSLRARRRDGPLPPRPMDERRLHPPRAVSLLGRRGHRRPRRVRSPRRP